MLNETRWLVIGYILMGNIRIFGDLVAVIRDENVSIPMDRST